MRLSSRLLLPLLGTVAIVMGAYGAWAIVQRERTLTEESRRETNAYAAALELAIEAALRDTLATDIQEIIDRISRERTVYGVIVYGPDADVRYASTPITTAIAPSEVVERALSSGAPASVQRELDDQRVYSVVRAIRDREDRSIGAFEVAQPLVFLESEIARTRQRFILNTVTLLAAVTALILWLVRRLVSRPLGGFVAAAHALGRGNLEFRIGHVSGGAELNELGDALNRMAEQLQAARAEILRESDERVSLERRLRETEKLAAVGNLAASLGHEIAAPLHVIRGRAELLRRKGAVDDAEGRNLRIIREQIDRITLIVQNLLDFARRREPRLENLDAADLLTSVLEFLDTEIGGSRVEVNWTGDRLLPVRADPDLLHQVFTNILMNAVQALAGFEERRISIRTAVAATQEDRRPGESGPVITIEIEDTGPGIPPDILPRVFEPFITTKAAGSGTGLGLAVVRSIIDEHGGHVDAENRVEAGAVRGSRFRITLPYCTSPESVDA